MTIYGFNKDERSTFSYWFAHWCAFQMVALDLHVWKFRYLFHDIEKPWLRLFMPYEKVQSYHRNHSSHHIEYLKNHLPYELDIEAMVIDNECSRFTKQSAPLTAIEYCQQEIEKLNALKCWSKYESRCYVGYRRAILKAIEIGLHK